MANKWEKSGVGAATGAASGAAAGAPFSGIGALIGAGVGGLGGFLSGLFGGDDPEARKPMAPKTSSGSMPMEMALQKYLSGGM